MNRTTLALAAALLSSAPVAAFAETVTPAHSVIASPDREAASTMSQQSASPTMAERSLGAAAPGNVPAGSGYGSSGASSLPSPGSMSSAATLVIGSNQSTNSGSTGTAAQGNAPSAGATASASLVSLLLLASSAVFSAVSFAGSSPVDGSADR